MGSPAQQAGYRKHSLATTREAACWARVTLEVVVDVLKQVGRRRHRHARVPYGPADEGTTAVTHAVQLLTFAPRLRGELVLVQHFYNPERRHSWRPQAPEEALAGAYLPTQADAIAGLRILCKQLCQPLGGSLRRCDHSELLRCCADASTRHLSGPACSQCSAQGEATHHF